MHQRKAHAPRGSLYRKFRREQEVLKTGSALLRGNERAPTVSSDAILLLVPVVTLLYWLLQVLFVASWNVDAKMTFLA